MSIVLNQQQLDEYRTQRRLNRARWVGGGFGFSGAMKGAIKAGALNMVSGALHGVFNVGAKALSMVGDAIKKSSLYSKSKRNLTAEIYNFVFQLHYVVWNLIVKNEGRKYVECLDYDAEKDAEAALKKFFAMNKLEVLRAFPDVLLKNPYDENLYKSVLSLFGDPKGELEKIAGYFGIDISLFAEEKEARAEKDLKERTVNFIGKAVVFTSREEAQKVINMPEFKELENEYIAYTHIDDKTKRPPVGGIEKICTLLKKMPTEIRDDYLSELKSFAAEQKKTLDGATLRVKPIIILVYVIAVIGFIACLPFWDTWNWWGLKGVVTACLLLYYPIWAIKTLTILIMIRISQIAFMPV